MTDVNKLINDSIDVWTSAIKKRNSQGRGSSKKIELTGVKKLRELILELAVRGKLVPQDPKDEHASVLLEKIAEQKAQLIADKKIKKQKLLPKITKEETPFELPNGWGVARLGAIGVITSSSRVNKKDWQDKGVPFYRAREIVQLAKTGSAIDDLFISDSLFKKLSDEGISPDTNDIMITGVGTIGVPYIVKHDDKFYFKDASVLIFKNYFNFDADYLKLFCTSPYWNKTIHSKSMGTTVHTLTIVRANESILIVPPLAEQHRIVAKVDELMALCDQLEQQTDQSITAHKVLVKELLATLTATTINPNTNDVANIAETFQQNWQRIADHFDVLFTTEDSIEQLKQTILQLAVMGKLVPQNPSDEPASVLLEKIAQEKAQLIADKKIKKQKPLPAIKDEEKPFELPSNWEFSRIVDASLFTEYGTSQKAFEGADGVPVLKMGDIQSGKVLHGGQKVVPLSIDDLPNLFLEYGDVLYNRTNSAELVGKTGMFEGDSGSYTFASYLIRIRCHFESITPQYLTLSMNTPVFRRTQIDPHVKQQCGQANVNGTLMKSMIVSVPPLPEQHRIVAKVDELMALCDQLKARLADAQTTQLHLADAVVTNALETNT